MSLEYIRKTYNVPAYRGQNVEYTETNITYKGTIIGSRGAHLNIKLESYIRSK